MCEAAVNRRTGLLAASGLSLALAATHVSPVISLTKPGRKIFPVLTRIPGTRSVALTFDDGPDRSTEVILKTLDERHVTATFFVTGEQVERFPTLVQEMLQAGHEIGIHGYSHRHHLLMTPAQVAGELKRARATIEHTTGRPATLFRPPHGIFSLSSWRAVGRHGWHRVLWSRWGKDWRTDATTETIVECIGQPEAGDVILLHDSDRYAAPGCWRKTVAALPRIIDRIEGQGLRAASIGALFVSPRD